MQAIFHVKLRRLTAILLLVVLCIPVPVSAAETQAEKKVEEKQKTPAKMVLAAQNDTLDLYYSKEKARVVVQNKKTGYLWDSAMAEQDGKETKVQKQEMQSLLQLTYTAINSLSSKTTSSALESLKYSLQIEKINNGFAYVIALPKLDMKIRMEFCLDDYGMKVSIPKGGVQETIAASRKIEEYQKELKTQLKELKKEFQSIQEDEGLTKDLQKKMQSAINELKTIEKMVRSIKNAYGIKEAGNQISDEIEKLDKQVIGTSQNAGFFTQLLTSEDVSDETKNDYRSYIQEVKDQELQLKIQVANMQEISDAALVSVDVLPYFGAANDKSEGYMLYPDGCGALTYFKEKHGEFQSRYEADTYAFLTPDIDWEEAKEAAGLYNQAIPYFGIKNGENGCIAYVCKGQELSKITFSPSGYVLPVNRIGAGFTYRQLVATSSVNGQWQSGADTQVFQQNPAKTEMAVEYQFLNGKQANYSGMACALRNYMEKQGILKESELVKQKKLPLALDFFGTSQEKVLMFKKSVTGTTINQASGILDALTGMPILCNYKGIYKEGYGVYPSSFQLSRAAGTKEQLRKLSKKLEKTGGKLFLESNQLLADYDQKGYKEGDLAIGNQYQVIKSTENEEKMQYLLTPKSVKSNFDKNALPKLKGFGKAGITETMMGDFVYADYGKQHGCDRSNTVKLWKQILKDAKKNLQGISVEQGSDYTFSSADWLRKIPTDVSGYTYTDESVPFYSMLVHGKLTGTSTPINQFYNKKQQLLKSMEYGLLPYYSLSAEELDLKGTDVYTSRFADMKDEIWKTYQKYEKVMEGLTDVAILSHERKGDKVVVRYENGTVLLINYAKKETKINGTKVGPMDIKRVNNKEVAEDETKGSLSTNTEKSNKVKTAGRQNGISVYSSLVVGIFAVLFISVAVFGSISFFKYHRS